jgi:hypothetical protein
MGGVQVNMDALIKELRAGTHELYPTADANDIAVTEKAIGKSLPESYKKFVREFSNGAYLYTLQEVSAVGAGNNKICAIQNIRPFSLPGKPNQKIPFHDGGQAAYEFLIPFGLDSNANEWCFIAQEGIIDNEYEVGYLHTEGLKLYGRMKNFSGWVQMLTEKQDELIRVIYENDAAVKAALNLG